MMKKIISLILLAMLMCTMALAESPSYDIVYTSENPIPDIADRVRPAVVQVISACETWDATTRIASTEDISSGSGCSSIRWNTRSPAAKAD